MTDTPKMLGKYRITEELGHGSFGVVYLAQDTTLRDRPVALKVLHPQLVVDPDTVGLFREEAGTMAHLEHPHIVTVYEAGDIQGVRFIAMRYVRGQTLAQAIAGEGPQPLERISGWLEQVASALDYAHRQGVLHRDIKPGNILLDPEDRAVVTDFGLAKAVSASGGSVSTQDRELLSGTARYMAPEQAKGKPVPQSDVYSLGVVLYELLTGQVPFDGDDPFAIAIRHMTEEPRPPRELRSDLPEAIDAVVLRALAKEPGGRWQTAGEMARAFQLALERDAPTPRSEPSSPDDKAEDALQRRGAASQAPRRAQRPRPMHRAAWFWPAVGAAGLLLLAMAVALWLLYGGRAGGVETSRPEPTQVAVVNATATATLTPTCTATATHTPRPPTQTPTPTRTLSPPTDTLRATYTPLPSPTETLVPTATPIVVPSKSTPLPTSPPQPSVGGRIAFHAWDEGGLHVYTVSPDGTGLLNLTRSIAGALDPRFSLDGKYIMFRTGDPEWGLYVIRADGGGLTRIAPRVHGMAWSLDSNRLAFRGDLEGVGGSRVYLSDVSSASTWLLWDSPSSCFCWSPDNRYILATGSSPNQQVFLLDSWGQEPPRHLMDTQENSRLTSCSWSPEGSRLAVQLNTYIPDVSYDFNLYVVNSDGTGLRALSSPPASDGAPAWSPNGKQILFQSHRDGNYDIYLIDPDGSNLTNLTGHPAGDYAPTWSPAGDYIAFVSDRNGNREIYVMKADGTGVTQVTNIGHVSGPSWGRQ